MLDGGIGDDTATYASARSGVTLDLADRAFDFGDSVSDIFVSIERFEGPTHIDRLLGNAFANVLLGGRGNDELDGRQGANTLDGGDGDDVVVYDSVDTFTHVTGGTGTDTLAVHGMSIDGALNIAAQSFERVTFDNQGVDFAQWLTLLATHMATIGTNFERVYYPDATRFCLE